MKKIVSTSMLIIALLFTVSVFTGQVRADDGTTHSGGKSCPSGQTCFASIPNPEPDTTVYTKVKNFVDYLNNLFG